MLAKRWRELNPSFARVMLHRQRHLDIKPLERLKEQFLFLKQATFTIAPLVESDNPSSPHFSDQTARLEMKPLPFTDDEVKRLTEKSYRLKF
ncbi:MAG: hypothetical protein ACE15B_15745 [Bryobacteraceae bacterium]